MGSLGFVSDRLFQPLKIGNMHLQHRLPMAPLTRFRADDEHVPLPFVKTYYQQRASVPGTFIISEGIFISPRGIGYLNAPGIFSDAQVEAWKDVTAAVHAKGSYIYLQLWAMGRAAQPNVVAKQGLDIVSSSAVPMEEGAPVPRPLSEEEIQQFIADYASAARNAIRAGFDGVEVHGANGYLLDQFLQDTCNHRTDRWGGSIENRARLHLEVTKAVVEAVGADRTGIRLSPWSDFQGMGMADPIPQFTYLVKELKKLNIAYLHLVESRSNGNADREPTGKNDFALEAWENQTPVLLAGGWTPESARVAVNKEYAKYDIATVFGRYFISNPDLPFRVQKGINLVNYDRSVFYAAKEERGYTTYPYSEDFQNEVSSRL